MTIDGSTPQPIEDRAWMDAMATLLVHPNRDVETLALVRVMRQARRDIEAQESDDRPGAMQGDHVDGMVDRKALEEIRSRIQHLAALPQRTEAQDEERANLAGELSRLVERDGHTRRFAPAEVVAARGAARGLRRLREALLSQIPALRPHLEAMTFAESACRYSPPDGVWWHVRREPPPTE